MPSSILLLRNQRLPKLHEIQKLTEFGFNEWLSTLKFKPIGNLSRTTFKLQVDDLVSYTAALGWDFVKNANAALETTSSIQRHDKLPKSLSWPIIKSYYASYFAAHSIMRVYCSGVVKLEKGQIDQIEEVYNLLGETVASTPEPGNYFLNLVGNEVEFTFVSTNSHESVWISMDIFLESLSNRISTSSGLSIDKNELIVALKELRDGIKREFPSSIRNKVNYKQDFGVWYPFSSYKEAAYKNLFDSIERWKISPIVCSTYCREANSLKRLVAISSCLVSILRETILDVESIAGKGSAFLPRKGARLLKELIPVTPS